MKQPTISFVPSKTPVIFLKFDSRLYISNSVFSSFVCRNMLICKQFHNNVIKWKHFPRYWPFVQGIHRYPVNSPHKGQWRGALIFSLICARIIGWVKNREAADLRRYCAHFDVTVMLWYYFFFYTHDMKLIMLYDRIARVKRPKTLIRV